MFNQHLLNKELGTFEVFQKVHGILCLVQWGATLGDTVHVHEVHIPSRVWIQSIHSLTYNLHIVAVLSTRPSTCQSSGCYSVSCELPAIMFSRFQKLTLSRKLSWTSFTIYSTCIIFYIAFIGSQAGGHRIAAPQLWKLCNSLGKTLMI